MMPTPKIRVIAICVFRSGSRILVGSLPDDAIGHFYRPLGGAIEFGETAVDAIRREVREELQQEIASPVLLGVLEDVWFDARPGHEIVFVFDAQFADRSLYTQSTVPINELGWEGDAFWLDLEAPFNFPLVPSGLASLISGGNRALGLPTG